MSYLFDELIFPSVKSWSSLYKELQKFVNPEAQNQNMKSNLNTNTIYIISIAIQKNLFENVINFKILLISLS